ncbi:hypothetical protein [Methylobacterium nodulans]|uniref:ASCH domain-containing protein n=1 Tax=Methylobacterium nodulans (strain LMG 21967 / CNCM I-2342 / ORS 2060) TaxID=460265 RepID=B8IHP8_METNO|nr:hypothetical protein [Methylobacterium nodulans]ACL61711.1 conserved hypothetical protein [Methylobacterium nodulans ORS 2060]
MVAYNFKPRFVEPIALGAKAQTIRAHRGVTNQGRHARPGEALQLYTGQRTRHCKLIGRTTCESVDRIILTLPSIAQRPSVILTNGAGTVTEDTDDPAALDAFARRDGFRDFDDLAAFRRAEHPDVWVFSGVVIRWPPFQNFDALGGAA